MFDAVWPTTMLHLLLLPKKFELYSLQFCNLYLSMATTQVTTTLESNKERRDAILAYAIYFGVIVTSHIWINSRQSQPYMDELYHVPQAIAYCRGDFTTYSKHITTPPGPYVISVILSFLTGCNVQTLRFHSALATFATLPLLAKITKSYRTALILATHPPLLFFSSLYYTDTFGICMILLCWVLARSNKHFVSALFGVCATFCRQTYALWHAFIAILSILQSFRFRSSWIHIILPHTFASFLYVALFAYNNFTIAIGDQSHHVLTFHAAQICYHVAYRAVFAAPLFLFVRYHSRAPPLFAVIATFACAILAIAHTGDTTHPFVLADNRHFVFYLYRRVLLRGAWVRFSIAPLYTIAALFPFDFNRNIRTVTWSQWLRNDTAFYNVAQFITITTVAITVVPSPLLEPRYYIPGFIFAMALFLERFRFRISNSLLAMSLAFNLVVLFALLFVFAEMPFQRPPDIHMPTDTSPGRFML